MSHAANEKLITENYLLKQLIEKHEETNKLKTQIYAFRMDHKKNSTKEHIQKIKDNELTITKIKDLLINIEFDQEKN